MKKISLSIAALAVVLAVTFTSCKKDDTGIPVVSLTGDGTIAIELGATWTDPGATATDDNDGTITPVVTGTVNTDKVGEYPITYTATDEAGNVGTATRTVIVKANALAGTYTVNETLQDQTTDTYTSIVTVSGNNNTLYNKLVLSNFGKYGSASVATITVTSTGFTGADYSFTDPDVGNVSITNITGTYVKSGTHYYIATASYKTTTTDGTTTTTQVYAIQ